MSQKGSIPHKKGSAFTTLAETTGALVGLSLAAAGGWIAYSRLVIDHQVPLEKAIDAEMKTLPFEEVGSLAYYMDASAEGRPLVLIHSVNAAASAYEMAPIFNRYRGSRPIYALDLPGFGFSSRPAIDYSPRIYQESILALLNAIDGQPADVIALSLGCEFAARAAAIQPERFHSLTMISPTGFRRPAAGENTLTPRQNGNNNKSYRLLSNPTWALPLYDLIATRPSIRYFLQMSFVGPVPEAMVEYAYATAHQPGAQHAPLHFISGNLFTKGVLPAFYTRLECPVLVVYDQDAFTGFDALPDVLAAHANWKAAHLVPTRGLPQFEQMDQLAQALNGFWAGPPE